MQNWRAAAAIVLGLTIVLTLGCVNAQYQTVTRRDRTQIATPGQHGPAHWGPLLKDREYAVSIALAASANSSAPIDEETGATAQSVARVAGVVGIAHALRDNLELGFHYQISPSTYSSSVDPAAPIPGKHPGQGVRMPAHSRIRQHRLNESAHVSSMHAHRGRPALHPW